MNLEENATVFFKEREIDVKDLIGSIGAEDGDVLLLSGSVVEGLANDDSDIDFLLISDRENEKSLAFQEEDCIITTFYTDGDDEINIYRYPFKALDRLSAVMDNAANILKNPSAGHTLQVITANSDHRFLHRVRTSVNFGNVEKLEEIRKKLRSDLYPKYCLLSHAKLHFPRREDAIAEFELGQLQSASWVLRQAASYIGGAYLASIGHTHHNDRWRIRLLNESGNESCVNKLIEILTGDMITTESELNSALDVMDEVFLKALSPHPELVPIFMNAQSVFPTRRRLA